MANSEKIRLKFYKLIFQLKSNEHFDESKRKLVILKKGRKREAEPLESLKYRHESNNF
jgi:hypothetical protein